MPPNSDRIEAAIEKLTSVSADLKAMLAVHEQRITHQEKETSNLDLKFDTTWYTAVAGYAQDVASTVPSASTALNTTLGYGGQVLLSPQLLAASGAVPQFGQIPNLTPLRYRSIVNDKRDNTGLNVINNPAAQVSASVFRSIYSKPSGDMVTVDLRIVGDPTMIKQDDWLYIPSPSVKSNYNDASMSAATFANKFGHLRMDTGALIVSLTINTPLDIDTDFTNKGQMFPEPSSYKSLFSGQYKVLTIKNSFANGKFEQVLKLVRLMSSAYTDAATPDTNRGTVGKTFNAQNSTNATTKK